MELFSALFVVFFFVILNEVRVAFVGERNNFSEGFMAFSSIIAGVLFSIVASA